MKIKTNSGTEIELLPEELRHFNLDSAKKLKDFIEELEKTKRKVGFSTEKKK